MRSLFPKESAPLSWPLSSANNGSPDALKDTYAPPLRSIRFLFSPPFFPISISSNLIEQRDLRRFSVAVTLDLSLINKSSVELVSFLGNVHIKSSIGKPKGLIFLFVRPLAESEAVSQRYLS